MLFSGKVIEPKLNKLAKKNDCIEIYIPIYCRINIVFLAMYISNCGEVRDMQVTAVISIFF
jgi:hypothetical protein